MAANQFTERGLQAGRFIPRPRLGAWAALGVVVAQASVASGQSGAPAAESAVAESAVAESAVAESAVAESAVTAETARLDEAFQCFNEGVRLYEAGEFRAALAQFERAYALVPHHQVLYNIGRANFQLGQYAQARRGLERYLREGGTALTPERVAQVNEDLGVLRAKTATLSLSMNVLEAAVFIDAVAIPAAPSGALGSTGVRWADIVLDAGAHRLRVSQPGHVSIERNLSLAHGDDVQLVLQLLPLTAALPEPPVDRGRAPAPSAASWVPWAITSVLAAGWLTTTALAVQAQADKDQLEDPRTPPARLDAAVSRLKVLAVASDVLLVSSLAGVGISAYLTWWPDEDASVAGPMPPVTSGVWGIRVGGQL